MTDRFRDQLQSALAPAYTIERELTGGGMSHVFVAVEHALNRTVVVKVLKPELAAGVNRERFRREIMLAAQLQHPHIVPVLNAGEHDDLLWYTMPFVEGESMREALARGRAFSARDVTRVLHDVLDALAYAHRRGVVHRDIKPGNILRHGTHSLVTDFGVAKALSASLPHSGTTSVGIAIGTPAYMAPEQLAADPSADHRMDLYAVGLLAYELLTGVQPFSGSSPQATMAAQLTRMPTPLEECCPGVPPQLASLVMRLLAKQPDDRPATAAAALEELETFSTPPGATAPTTAPTARPSLGDTSSSGATTPLAGGVSSGAPAVSAAPVSRGRRVALLIAGGLAFAVAGLLLGRELRQASRDRPVGAPNAGFLRESTFAVAVPLPSVLTRADSLRIADAVRRQLASARQADARRPGPDRNLDSMQHTLVRVYVDSAMRHVGVRGEAPGTPLPPPPRRQALDTSRGARATERGRGAATAPSASASSATRAGSASAPGTGNRPGVGGRTVPPRLSPRRTLPDGRPQRVALLPVRDGTARPALASIARTLEDSLRNAVNSAGFTLASDAELVRLLSTTDPTAQRRVADAAGIGAIVTAVLTVREDELVAQAIVLDVWRASPLSEREETALDEPQAVIGLARGVTRALNRVSWRVRGEPKRILFFDIENQTGMDSLGVIGQQLADSLRTVLAKRLSVQFVTDAEARATTGTNERRLAGARVGAGAIVAGSIYRVRGDSLTLRIGARDMTEDTNFTLVEIRLSRRAPLDIVASVAERLAADLGKVNWGPKGLSP